MANRARVNAGVGALTAAIWLGLVLSLPDSASRIASLAAVATGAAVLVGAIVWRRPAGWVGWSLVAASALVVLGEVAAGHYPLVDSSGARGFLVASMLLMAAGLGYLGRRPAGSVGIADVLDTVLAVAGAVLVTWIFVGDPPLERTMVAEAIVLAIAALLVLGTAAKLWLAAVRRAPACMLVAIAAVALLAAAGDVALPAVDFSGWLDGRFARGAWTVHGLALGATGLHPSFATAINRLVWSGSDPAPPRFILFGLIAALVPTAIVVGLVDKPVSLTRSLGGILVPAVAATAVLLCLIGRLALIARVSQRRATELGKRSAALADAIGQQQALQEELAFRAMHDPLTGLSNRVVLAERLSWLLGPRAVPGSPVLLLLDLDGFKDVNDTYGHPVGDELLGAVARRLVPIVPDTGVVARIGGDEFAVLLETATEAEARTHADAILAAIQEPFPIDTHELRVSASIGLLVIDRSGEPTPADVLRDADLALYSAKGAGRSRVSTFDPAMRIGRTGRSRINVGLHRALARGELDLDYQPIVRLATGAVEAVEALVRWRPPGSPEIPPAQFIPVAQASGLIGAIGARVLRQACSDAVRWHSDRGVAVSVNVAASQLSMPGFADLVLETLDDTGLPAAGLILELTEAALVSTRSDAVETAHLLRLRKHGVRVAIDDFGTGYSSLAYLSRLPVDIVKLDRTFATGLSGPVPDEVAGRNFVSSIFETIASVGMQAVAEGVETAEQAAALRPMRCELAQGHFFYRSLSAAGIDDVLTV